MKVIYSICALLLAVNSSQASVWINEFHYDNSGADVNEFVEIAYTSQVDVTTHSVVLYNGINGATYSTLALPSGTSQGTGIYITTVAIQGLQNGPDGIALVDGTTNNVVEFISYEGTFTAMDGVAAGMTSIDVGTSESGSTGSNDSLQRTGEGCTATDFTWAEPQAATMGLPNVGQTLTCAMAEKAWINEFHYDNSGSDSGEFVEVAYTTNTDITVYALVVYNGYDGQVKTTKSIAVGSSAGSGVMLSSVSVPGLQNGMEGLALVDGSGNVVHFISYEGTFTAANGAAMGLTSKDVGVAETSSTNVGDSIQATGTGCDPADFTWLTPRASTKGSMNVGQLFDCQFITVGPVDEAMLSTTCGNGIIDSIFVAAESTETIGYLPAGMADIYIELDSTVDVDIQLFSGNAILVARSISDSKRQHTNWNGVRLEYSGYRGEDSVSTLGEEFLFLSGTISSDVTVKIYGAETGTATVKYTWGYYDTAYGKTGSNLATRLHGIVDGHTEISYTEAWEAIKRTDQYVNDSAYVMTLYSRRPTLKSDQDDGSNLPDDWNREHVWAKSHGDFGTRKGAGTDIHALRASDRSVNTERSSKDFAEGGSSLSNSEALDDCPVCLETSNSFEPPDEVKGSVARMIFYMATRYSGDNDSNDLTLTAVNGVGTSYGSSTSGYGELGDLATLLVWNDLYPPTDEEYYRNNIIFQIQRNRNPFIDHPDWANSVF